MSNRKACKECPWHNTNLHSSKWKTWAQKMKLITKSNHKCHMIDSKDIWRNSNSKNVCVGQTSTEKSL